MIGVYEPANLQEMQESIMPRKKGTLEKVTDVVTGVSETVRAVSETVEGLAGAVSEVAQAIKGEVEHAPRQKTSQRAEAGSGARDTSAVKPAKRPAGTKPPAKRQPSTQKRQTRPQGRRPRGAR